MSTPPDIEQWRALYDAAKAFQKAAPWDTLPDYQLFAVESPELAETLYCSVLGASENQRGLIAARGARGLLGYVLLTSGELDPDERAVEQDGLSFLLGDDQLITDEDREIHTKLGLEFNDESQWPLFLSLKPHYVGVRPDATESAALTIALEQAKQLAEGLRAGDELPEASDEQVVGRQKRDDGAWQTTVLSMPPAPPDPRLEADQVRCAAVLRFGRRSRQVWEVMAATLSAIDAPDGGPSFWARMLVCVDKDSKTLVGGTVMGPGESAQNALVSVIEQGGTIPRYLDISSGLLFSQLQPLADVLKIRLRRVESVPLADEARRAMKAALP